MANGWSVTVASMKMIVRPASKMLSAISFGVFGREAPSTSAIIRSRNVSPGLEVIRTTISSESTRVPPVTAERSPPDSRMTGADSPVIADSSTDAIPSITSPSPGMSSPAGTTHSSPMVSSLDDRSTIEPSGSRTRASVSERVLRSVSACALPRPSATASAKFANSTVNHSHADTSPVNTLSDALAEGSFWKNRIVVRTLPTSTMNITGLRAIWRGLSFTNESPIARRMIAESNNELAPAARVRTFGGRSVNSGCGSASGVIAMPAPSELSDEVFDDGTERNDREVGQPDDDDHDTREKCREQARIRRERPGRHRNRLLASERSRDCEHGDHQVGSLREHADGAGGV